MQSYLDHAEKNGITLFSEGKCQFCGANTTRGIHECVELFNLGFLLDFSSEDSHISRFLSVDAHTLQHSEIHGRWNNHFHLTRMHLMRSHNVAWTYTHSPKLSDYLNAYKLKHANEVLVPPPVGERGGITTTDVQEASTSVSACMEKIDEWSESVYQAWKEHHDTVDLIAKGFLAQLYA